MRPDDPDRLSVPPDGREFHEQPQWRNDFPIDWPQDELVSRRDFAKFLILTSFAFAVGQIWILFLNFLRRRRGQPPVRRIAAAGDVPVGGAPSRTPRPTTRVFSSGPGRAGSSPTARSART